MVFQLYIKRQTTDLVLRILGFQTERVPIIDRTTEVQKDKSRSFCLMSTIILITGPRRRGREDKYRIN
jgi:hypothetical protein